jgi:protein involved in polysaccharide export with SLBB domain
MKIIITSLLFLTQAFSQVSLTDIQRLSNTQLDLIKSEIKSQNVTKVDINEVNPQNVKIVSKSPKKSSEFFGYNYFQSNINFFDNIPTPADFKLGPGDEIILSLWGEINSRENFIINKEGSIFYPTIGFLDMSNKTIQEAELLITNELAKIYSSLTDEEKNTMLKLEVGRLKSMNVYFTGEVSQPGVSLIHPFSDIYASIVQAGGVKKNGSLRNIALIRNGEVIQTFDFYSFFINAENTFSSIRVLDGDTIHIPTIKKRVEVGGAINNPGFYELLENESYMDLTVYAGGIKSDAMLNAMINSFIPRKDRLNDDNVRITKQSLIENLNLIIPNDGDGITFPTISSQPVNVEIMGRVKNPGKYPASSTLKNVLDLAGGFQDPIFKESIIYENITVLRKDNNQIYRLEFSISYEESEDFDLIPGDLILVYENSFYNRSVNATIGGEVVKRGTFQVKKGTTVRDIINLAQGFTELANKDAIIVEQTVSTIGKDKEVFFTKEKINNANMDFEITKETTINILPANNTIFIAGNIYEPGFFAYDGGSVTKYISMAGGLKKDSNKRKIYVVKQNGRTVPVNTFMGLILSNNVDPGDKIVIPIKEKNNDFNVTSFVTDITSLITNLIAIAAIIDNSNN